MCDAHLNIMCVFVYRLNEWLKELCSGSSEPYLLLTSIPSLKLTSSLFYVAITSKGTQLRCVI